MKKIHLVLVFAVIFLLSLTTRTTLASAQMRQWAPRTADVIREEIEKNKQNGVSSYTVKWGDTLYEISKATDLSIEQLIDINAIQNTRVIDTGTVLYFDNIVANEQVTKLKMKEEHRTVLSTEHYLDLQLLDGNTTPSTHSDISPVVSQEVARVEQDVTSPKLYALNQFMFHGIIHWNGLKFTYYSQSVLPGGGLSIPGRHVNEAGYVADGDGYIVVANDAPLGTVVETPFGYKGKVYDRGTVGNHFDVYVQ